MLKVSPSTTYDVLFSIIAPEPHNAQPSWNGKEAFDGYLAPIVQQLKPVMDIKVGSQVGH